MTDDFHPPESQPAERAEVVLACSDLNAALAFYTEQAGFRLEMIMPADAPSIALVSNGNLMLRLEQQPVPGEIQPTRIRLPGDNGTFPLHGPDGVVVESRSESSCEACTPESAEWIISRSEDGTAWVQGRAGMEYRDLIPGRRQQSVIASHIRIVRAGPVSDYVHYHRIGFQMIYCRRGWARLVYADQGPPFILNAGDCILQPPTIRHQVLEASAGLEVIELSSPAQHETWRDHEMTLPSIRLDTQRDYSGQRFLRHIAVDAQWLPLSMGEASIRYTGISTATHDMASARVLRIDRSLKAKGGRFLFLFVLSGSCDLHVAGIGSARLLVDDASLLPSFADYELVVEETCELLEVSLPANPHP